MGWTGIGKEKRRITVFEKDRGKQAGTAREEGS